MNRRLKRDYTPELIAQYTSDDEYNPLLHIFPLPSAYYMCRYGWRKRYRNLSKAEKIIAIKIDVLKKRRLFFNDFVTEAFMTIMEIFTGS